MKTASRASDAMSGRSVKRKRAPHREAITSTDAACACHPDRRSAAKAAAAMAKTHPVLSAASAVSPPAR
jgi:hypothetical protein